MDNTIFKKLKAKPDMIATLLYAPHEYPSYYAFSDTKDNKGNKSEFVHLFVKSQAEFAERFSEASNAVADGGCSGCLIPNLIEKTNTTLIVIAFGV